MQTNYDIKDAKEALKALNNFLVLLGTDIMLGKATLSAVEDLMNDFEFGRLCENTRFFNSEGHAYLAKAYADIAANHDRLARRDHN
jgi:hypothetical protein